MVGFTVRWFTSLQTVTHPSGNRAHCRATSLIETNVLTTTPGSHKNNDAIRTTYSDLMEDQMLYNTVLNKQKKITQMLRI